MLSFIWQVLLVVLAIAGLAATALGGLVFFHILRPQRRPADRSNRINKVRLVWFALTREDLFAATGNYPWLLNDEYENVKDVKSVKPSQGDDA